MKEKIEKKNLDATTDLKQTIRCALRTVNRKNVKRVNFRVKDFLQRIERLGLTKQHKQEKVSIRERKTKITDAFKCRLQLAV